MYTVQYTGNTEQIAEVQLTLSAEPKSPNRGFHKVHLEDGAKKAKIKVSFLRIENLGKKAKTLWYQAKTPICAIKVASMNTFR